MPRAYYELAKPGIVYGNLLTTLAAYVYAARWELTNLGTWATFLATMIGLGFVIASACVFNNFIDRDIDKKMKRTKDRALAAGAISNENALLYGAVLCLAGFTLLIAFVNLLTAFIAFVGFAVYVFAYTMLKRTTEWATEIGSIAGATPVVVGYTAVTARFDLAALMLFLILVLWQMPHFFSIAMFRSEEYAAANIPVLPLVKGVRETRLRAVLYIMGFVLAVLSLTAFTFAGYTYLVVTEAAALVWYWQATVGFNAGDTETWARRLFFLSFAVLLVFSAMLSVASVLP